jgi:hypothetical protein
MQIPHNAMSEQYRPAASHTDGRRLHPGWATARSNEDCDAMVFQQRTTVGRAYRDGSLVCGRVHVKIGHDDRLGLAPDERRYEKTPPWRGVL